MSSASFRCPECDIGAGDTTEAYVSGARDTAFGTRARSMRSRITRWCDATMARNHRRELAIIAILCSGGEKRAFLEARERAIANQSPHDANPSARINAF
jgi:hypothetical protein